MAESMLDTLTTYYQGQGILSTHFTCPHKAAEGPDGRKGCGVCACGPGACHDVNCTRLTGPGSAFVSTGYEDGPLPRLLFVSLDRGEAWESPDDLLPHQVAPRVEADSERVVTHRKTTHWYRTHEIAWYILKRFDSSMRLGDVRRHIALANAVKCCENKAGHPQAPQTMFENCQEHLAGEVKNLRPDVLVTQGDKAMDSVLSFAEPHTTPLTMDPGAGAGADERKWIDEFGSAHCRVVAGLCGHDVFWLHTSHPTSRPRQKGTKSPFYRQIDFDPQIKNTSSPHRCRGWLRYSEMIHRWWNEERATTRST